MHTKLSIITILSLSSLSLLRQEWRDNYNEYTFSSRIIENESIFKFSGNEKIFNSTVDYFTITNLGYLI